jgi:hypothetical protein
MPWSIYAMLLVLGAAGVPAPYAMAGGLIQIVMMIVLLGLAINRIGVISKPIERYQGI